MLRGAVLLLQGMLIGGLLVVLAACTPAESPALITQVQAAEFDAAPPASRPYRDTLIRNARAVWGMAAPVAMLAGQLMQESHFNPDARSRVGALGIAQFMPSTAKDYADEDGVQPLNPSWSIRAQSRYMRDLYGRVSYPRDCDRYGAALSSYNGGLGHHNNRRGVAENPDDFWNSVRVIRPPRVSASNQIENQEYPVRIVVKWQPMFRTWGPLVCQELLA